MLRDLPQSDAIARATHISVSDDAPDRVVIADAQLLLTGQYKKVGSDLIITGKDGQKIVVSGYFGLDKKPDLVTPDGAGLPGHLVERLAVSDAAGQYAQAGAPAGGGIVIGKVERLGGSATVQRANGVVEELKVGDNVMQGDIVETRDGSLLAINFTDGTAFNMGANARMVLSELVYEAGGSSNSAVFSLVKGTITFVAGQVAKTGTMRVDTPVATMGIRGTTVNTRIDTDANGNIISANFSLMADPDGKVGAFDIIDRATGTIIGRVTTTSSTFTVTPSANLGVLAQQLNKTPEQIAQELAVAQVLFPVFLANPANFQNQPQDPQPRGPAQSGSSSPPAGSTQPLPDGLQTVPGDNGNDGQNNGNTNNNDPDGPGNVPPPPVNLPPSIFIDGPAHLREAVSPSDADIDGDAGDPSSTANIYKVDLDGTVGYNLAAMSGWVSEGNGIYSKQGQYGTVYLDTNNNTIRYELDNEAADALGEGEHPTESFTIVVTDNAGASAQATVTYQVNGQNDPPQIVVQGTDAEGAITEPETPGETVASGGEIIELETGGTITFTDAELGDINDVSPPTFVSAVWHQNGEDEPLPVEGDPGSFDLGNLVEDSADNPGSVSWNYTIDDDAVDFLAEGETLVITYNVTITDEHGASITQPVTITITGTNDSPIITAAQTSGAVTEDSVVGSGSTLVDSGSISFDDVDTTDTSCVTFALKSHTGGLSPELAEALEQALSLSGDTHAHDGTVDWTFELGNHLVQYLAKDEVVTVTYTITVTDETGATATEDVTITITGNNDAPTVTASAPSNALEEGGSTTATVQLAVTDADESDTHTFGLGVGPLPTNAVEFNGHFYLFVPAGSISWTDARAGALAMGGYLANITSAAENAFVHNSVTHGSFGWLGGSDAGQEGVWTWADGPEAGQTFWTGAGPAQGGQPVMYANWWDAEPNGGLSENYVFIDHHAVWTDVAVTNGAVGGYVVEFSGNTQAGTYGSIVLNPQTGQVTYQLNNDDPDTQALANDQTVTEVFTIWVSDGHGGMDATQVTFTVTGTADGEPETIPSAEPFSGTEDQAGLISISLAGYDQGGGSVVGFKLTELPTGGTLHLSLDPQSPALDLDDDILVGSEPTITIYFKPAANFSGPTSFCYAAIDNEGNRDPSPARIEVDIAAVNDAPSIIVSENDSSSGSATEGNSPVILSNALTVSDPDEDEVTIDVVGIDADGPLGDHQETDFLQFLTLAPSVLANGNGHFTWTFNSGAETFDYLAVGQDLILHYEVTVTDSSGAVGNHIVNITITGTDDEPEGEGVPPIANDDSYSIFWSGQSFAVSSSLTDDDIDPDGWSLTITDLMWGDSQAELLNDVFTISGDYGTLYVYKVTGYSPIMQDNVTAGSFVYVPGAEAYQSLALSQIMSGHDAHDIFTYTVTDADGNIATASLDIDIGRSVFFSVQTPSGFNLANEDIAGNMGAAQISEQHLNSFRLVNAAADRQFYVYGTDFSYDNNGNVAGGAVTSIWMQDASSLDMLATISLNVGAVEFFQAVEATQPSQNVPGSYALFDALKSSWEYNFTGGSGADTFHGDDGLDSFFGNAGADFFDGGAGSNVMFGGAGADVLFIRPGAQGNSFVDFSVTEGDRIDLSALMWTDGNNVLHNVDWAYIQSRMSASEWGAMIDLGEHGPLLVMSDVQPSQLQEDDFIFKGTAAVSVQTDGTLGYNMGTFYADLQAVTIQPSHASPDSFLALGTGESMLVRGEGFTYGGSDLTGGTIHSFDIYNTATGAPIARMTGVEIDANALNAAITQYEASNAQNTVLLDAIFGNLEYSMAGGNGVDTLVGGQNDDVYFGGAGADNFVFSPVNGSDVITDFSHTQGDKIVLDDMYQLGSIDPNFTALLNSLANSDPSDYTIELPGSANTIKLNVAVNTLTTSDFIVHSMPGNPYA